MSSVYHILYKQPAIEASDILLEYEELAALLVKSGRLRIDTDDKCNFVRLNDVSKNVSLMLSDMEITDSVLLERTKDRLAKIYGPSSLKINKVIENLRSQLTKLQPVSYDIALRLSRILVQSTHPIVMRWLLYEGVEVFISYSHNIGDMMDISDWKVSGSNSGMQSTDGRSVAIFVSCGGDPFGKVEDEDAIYGDGRPAIARMQIIAAQELGHYADIKRDYQGRQIGRHSANFACTKAADHVKKARREDIKNCQRILAQLNDCGLVKLIFYENAVSFYRKNKIGGVRLWYNLLLALFWKKRLVINAHNMHLNFVQLFQDHKYMGQMIKTMIEDMQSNLTPIADVYKRDNKEAQEAIACVEALARVPQQVMKWGYLTTKNMMRELYLVYYGEVIPSLIDVYNVMNNTSYQRRYDKAKTPIVDKLIDIFKN
jgi:hypothetical protein